MKKHIVLIMNILLIAAIIAAIVFTVMRALQPKPVETLPTEPPHATEAATEAATVIPPGERFKVGIVRHGTDKDSDSCYAGFISQLNTRGLLDYIDVVYIIENDDELCKAEIQRLVDEGCDLLYTIGPFASKYASAATTEIPIVFAAVSDPEEMGLVESNEAPGGNVTGVSSYTPCFEQIDLIPILLPKTESIAAIYSSTDENAVRQAIIACWEAEEFKYSADRYPVNDKDGIAEAMSSIKEKGTDVIFLPTDKLMNENLGALVAFSQKNNIPIICGNRAMMNKGCLATCEINYTAVGRRSADLSYDILYGKKDPASLPVIYKYDCYNIVNKQAMERLGLELSEQAEANVEIVDTAKAEQ